MKYNQIPNYYEEDWEDYRNNDGVEPVGLLDFDTLFWSAIRCKKGVGWKGTVSHYILNIMKEIYSITLDLRYNTYTEKPHRVFKVYEPKEREVLSIHFRDRIYQRVLNDMVIYPTMTRSLIMSNAACQKNKGTDFARELLKSYLRKYYINNGNSGYLLHIDIKGYYPNMVHSLVEKMFEEHLDPDMYERVEKILDKYGEGVGYNPGSQLVQIAGISFLDKIDHYIKERLRVKYYIRYMDDMILLGTKEECERYLSLVTDALSLLGFKPNPTKTKIIKQSKGDLFLGFKFVSTQTGKVIMALNPQNIKRERIKLRKLIIKLNNGEITLEKFDAMFNAWWNHASKSTSKKAIDSVAKIYKEARRNYREQHKKRN